MPISKQIERKGGTSSPVVGVYPTIRAGICDRCGVLDPNVEGHQQYKLCEHYRGKEMGCSYCANTTDQTEVVRYSILKVFDSPDNPNELVVVCDASMCLDKHYKRFNPNA